LGSIIDVSPKHKAEILMTHCQLDRSAMIAEIVESVFSIGVRVVESKVDPKSGGLSVKLQRTLEASS